MLKRWGVTLLPIRTYEGLMDVCCIFTNFSTVQFADVQHVNMSSGWVTASAQGSAALLLDGMDRTLYSRTMDGRMDAIIRVIVG